MKKFLSLISIVALMVVFAMPVMAWNVADSNSAQWADFNMSWDWNHTSGTPDMQYFGNGHSGFVAGVEGSEAHSWTRSHHVALAGTKVFGMIVGSIKPEHNSISGWVLGANCAKAWGRGQKITEVNGGGTVILGLNLSGDTGGYSGGTATWNYAARNVDYCDYDKTVGGGFGLSVGSVSRTFGTNYVSASASNFTMAGSHTN